MNWISAKCYQVSAILSSITCFVKRASRECFAQIRDQTDNNINAIVIVDAFEIIS